MNWIRLLVEVLFGSATGYGTNSLAIKMLFRQYGPFGGMILKTREQFIDRISSLVERDIINGGTLERELGAPEFVMVFQGIVEEFLHHQLKNHTSVDTLGEVPGMDQLFSGVGELIRELCDERMEDVVAQVLPHIDVSHVVDKEQAEHVLSVLFDKAIALLEQSSFIEDTLFLLYQEVRKDELSSLIPLDVLRVVGENVEKRAKDFPETLAREYSSELEELLYKLFHDIDKGELVEGFFQELKEKTLRELLGHERTDSVTRDVLATLLRFLQTKEGRRLLEKLLRDGVQVLQGIKTPISQMFGRELGANLEGFFTAQFPQALEQLIVWLGEKSILLEQLIEDAIKETIQDSTGVRATIQKFLYGLIDQGITKKLSVVPKLIEAIRGKVDPRVAANEVTEQIVTYSRKHSIGDIFSSLEQRKLLKVRDMGDFLLRKAEEYLPRVDPSLLDALFDRPLGSLFTFDLQTILGGPVQDKLVGEIRRRLLRSKALSQTLGKMIGDQVEAMASEVVENLLPEKDFVHHVRSLALRLVKELENRKEQIIQVLLLEFLGPLMGTSLDELVTGSFKESVVYSAKGGVVSFSALELDKLGCMPIESIYERVYEEASITESITTGVLRWVEGNLHGLLEGRVKEAVSQNLTKLPNEDVQNMVESFMGSQLKPITLFGAGLGGIFGLGLFFLTKGASLDPLVRLPLYSGAFGLVGYITNVIALKMIFRPYVAWKLFGAQLPFTPGVVAKEKPRFAESMGRFVSEELLDAKRMDRLLAEKKGDVVKGLKEVVSKDDYAILTDLLTQQEENLRESISQLLFGALGRKKEEYVHLLAKKVQGLSLSLMPLDVAKEYLLLQSQRGMQSAEASLQERLSHFLRSSKTLDEVLPSTLDALDAYLLGLLQEQLDRILYLLEDASYVREFLTTYAKGFDDLLTKDVGQVIEVEEFKRLGRSLSDYLVNFLQRPQFREGVVRYLEEKFLSEIQEEKRIGDLFDGLLVKVLRDQARPLVKSTLSRLLTYISTEREGIKQDLREIARSNGGVAYDAGNMFLDFDGLLGRVVDRLIDYKLPGFLHCQEIEIEGIFQNALRRMEDCLVKDLKLELEPSRIQEVAIGLLQSPSVAEHVRHMVCGALDALAPVRIGKLLEVASLASFSDLVVVLDKEIFSLRANLVSSIKGARPSIERDVHSFAMLLVRKSALQVTLRDIFQGTEKEAVESFFGRIFPLLTEHDGIKEGLSELLHAYLSGVKKAKAAEFLEERALVQSIRDVYTLLLANPSVEILLEDLVGTTLRRFVSSLPSLVHDETKEYALHVLVESGLSSFENHFLQLINSINISRVTKDEINQMGPEKIEELFYSFAGPYFRKLEAYGFIGGGLGLGVELIKILGIL